MTFFTSREIPKSNELLCIIIQYEIQHSVHLIHSFHSFFFRSSLVLTWVLLLLFRLSSKFLIWSWAVRGIIFAIMGLNFILENCNDKSLQWFDKKSKRNFENLGYVFYLFDISGFSVEFWILICSYVLAPGSRGSYMVFTFTLP